MTRRHRARPGDWNSVVRRLEELVLANSGEDGFTEISKLLVAKAYVERHGDGQFCDGRDPAAASRTVDELLAAADEVWPGVLPRPAISLLSAEHLAICAQVIGELEVFEPTLEVLDAAFEHLMSRTAKGSKGQYFTPRHVIEAVVRCIGVRPHELLVDPACGSGGFLLHAQSLARRAGVRAEALGVDFDARAVQVARVLAAVSDLHDRLSIHRANSLLTSSASRRNGQVPGGELERALHDHGVEPGQLDAVVTNPPFAGEIRQREVLGGYELARGRMAVERDVLFVERCVRLLRPGGRLAIVLPHNKLGGSRHASLRAWLLEHLDVVAVLGLHRHTFLPHTPQKTAVLFGCRRNETVPGPRTTPILFAISEAAGKDSTGRPVTAGRDGSSWQRLEHDLDEFVERFHAHVRQHDPVWAQAVWT